MTEDQMQGLVDRLKKARCFKDENSLGWRVTKWFHLVPNDIDIALEYFQNKLNEDYLASKAAAPPPQRMEG